MSPSTKPLGAATAPASTIQPLHSDFHVHFPSARSREGHTCSYPPCALAFPTRDALISHYSRRHLPTFCPSCHTHYRTPREKDEHTRQKHDQGRIFTTTRVLYTRCRTCGEVYNDRWDCKCGRYDVFDRPGELPRPKKVAASAERAKDRAERNRDEVRKQEEERREYNRKEYVYPSPETAYEKAERVRAGLKKEAAVLEDEERKWREERRIRKERKETRNRERKEAGQGHRPKVAEFKRTDEKEKARESAPEQERRQRPEEREEPQRMKLRGGAGSPPEEKRQAPKKEERKEGTPLDLYAILGISPSATQAEVLKAAKKKRIATHPDRFSGQKLSPTEVDSIIEGSKIVGHAADILCDAAARLNYESELAAWTEKQRAAGLQEPEPEKRKAPSRPTNKDPAKSKYRDAGKFYNSDSSESDGDTSDDSSSTTANVGRVPRCTTESHGKDHRTRGEPRSARPSIRRPSSRSDRPKPNHGDFRDYEFKDFNGANTGRGGKESEYGGRGYSNPSFTTLQPDHTMPNASDAGLGPESYPHQDQQDYQQSEMGSNPSNYPPEVEMVDADADEDDWYDQVCT